jgi:hypothetical protein
LTKRTIAILGIILLLLGVVSLVLLIQDRAAALGADQLFIFGDALGEEENCRNIIQEVSIPNRVMTENESQTLRVVVANIDNPGVCNTTVVLAALDFDIAPASTARNVSLEQGQEPVTLLWVLKPRELGAFEIAVTAGNQTQVIGIVVTNVLGLTAAQVEILSYISSFLGPMLTAPWWYEQWEKRRGKAKREEVEAAAINATADQQSANKEKGTNFQPE